MRVLTAHQPKGKMMHFASDRIVLEGVACRSKYYGYCSCSTYPYGREIWPKRVE